ncbi:MAG: hypothetical protein ACREMX_15670, partial [Gemmatimonadales bacterium]
IVRGPLRRLAEHAWRLWRLLPPAMRILVKRAAQRLGVLLSGSDLRTVTVAYVLTDIAHDSGPRP